MREVEGAGILHKSDNDYNMSVTYLIKLAKQTVPKDYIDVLRQSKNEEEITKSGEDIDYVVEEVISQDKQEDMEEER